MFLRVVFAALILLAATCVKAELVKVTEVGDTVYYVESGSIRDEGGFRRVGVVQDFGTRERADVRSRRVSYEIDCASQRLRSLSVVEYSQPMAKGDRMGSLERESDWLYVAPRTGSNIAPATPYRQIVKYVCAGSARD